MNLEEMKTLWETQNRKLDLSLRLNVGLLMESRLLKAKTALRRLGWLLGIDLALGVLMMLLLGSFVADHVAAPRYAIPAIVLGASVILLSASSVRQLAAISSIDYGSPVLEIQKRLESLRRERLIALKYVLVLSPLLWILFFIVAVKGLLGVDVYAVSDGTWLAGNLLFGIAFIPVAIWLCRRYADRIQRSPLARSLARDLAGYNLAAAEATLASLEEFGREQCGGQR